jgi:hypothetical protein
VKPSIRSGKRPIMSCRHENNRHNDKVIDSKHKGEQASSWTPLVQTAGPCRLSTDEAFLLQAASSLHTANA